MYVSVTPAGLRLEVLSMALETQDTLTEQSGHCSCISSILNIQNLIAVDWTHQYITTASQISTYFIINVYHALKLQYTGTTANKP